MPRLPSPCRSILTAALLMSVARAASLAEPAASHQLQALVDTAVQTTVSRFRETNLQPDQLAVTVLDLHEPAAPVRASWRGNVSIYPASVIKLFYLAAAHRWMEDGKLPDTPELRRAMKDMIVDSSNDATHYVIDLLTGTTSGPELPEAELRTWFEKRHAVTRYFASLGYRDVLAHKKPWGDGPYGRESQAIALFQPKRNMLTTDATARLLGEIASSACVNARRSTEMMQLLARNLAAPSQGDDSENQARFTGPALPAGARLWSKAGWTSQTRHDAAYIELPNGARFVLVVFTTNHAKNQEIIRSVAKVVSDGFATRKISASRRSLQQRHRAIAGSGARGTPFAPAYGNRNTVRILN